MIILDFGSGNTCKNDFSYVKKMIDELSKVDKDRKCIIKWQLWKKKQGHNKQLDWKLFKQAYNYAEELGFTTTSSIFDKESLKYLLTFKTPFIKIACNPGLYWLIYDIQETSKILVSAYTTHGYSVLTPSHIKVLFCVPLYPADIKEYLAVKYYPYMSDHTPGIDLYQRLKPKIWEKHFILSDSTGLDAGEWAITPEQLKEVL